MKDDNALEYILNVMQTMNSYDSFGCIFLKNGISINVLNNFELIDIAWRKFNYLKNSENKEEFDKFLELTNGGIVGDGTQSFKLDEVVATVAVSSFFNNNEPEKRHYYFDKAKLTQLYLENISGFNNEIIEGEETED